MSSERRPLRVEKRSDRQKNITTAEERKNDNDNSIDESSLMNTESSSSSSSFIPPSHSIPRVDFSSFQKVPPSSRLRSADGWALMIAGLSYDTREDDVYTLFIRFGSIKSIQFHYNRRTGQGSGYCLLLFNDFDAAATAIEELNGSELLGEGYPLAIDFAFREDNHRGGMIGANRRLLSETGGSREEQRGGRGRDWKRGIQQFPSKQSRSPKRSRSRSRRRSRSSSRSRSRSRSGSSDRRRGRKDRRRKKSRSPSSSRSRSRSRSPRRSKSNDRNEEVSNKKDRKEENNRRRHDRDSSPDSTNVNETDRQQKETENVE